MASLTQSRRFSVSTPALAKIRELFSAGRADEDETAATIRTTLRETSHLVDPHTAVGLAVAEKESRDPTIPMIVLGTAHPAKFPDAVERATGQRLQLPTRVGDLFERDERYVELPGDYDAIAAYVAGHAAPSR
jgi:threonine synthase